MSVLTEYDTKRYATSAYRFCGIPEDTFTYNVNEPLTFVGHYWMNDEPGPLTDNVACLYYSVAKGGNLCACRYSGESRLDKSKFVWA